jgi:hypothetical protein
MNSSKIKLVTFIIAAVFLFCYKFCCTQPKHTNPPLFKINLDLEPEKRWDSFIQQIPKSQILELIHTLQPVFQRVGTLPNLDKLIESNLLTQEYTKELQGMVSSLHKKFDKNVALLNYENLFILNILYELFVCCTSGIIVGEEGIPYLFRTLDWPLFTQTLKKNTINIEWYKNGSCLFKSTGFPLLVGVYTGQKDNAFALSINSRHEKEGSIAQNIQTYLNNPQNRWTPSILARHILQYEKTFNNAVSRYKTTKLISPVFVAIAGTKKNEGITLARSKNNIVETQTLQDWQEFYPSTDEHTNPLNNSSPLIANPALAKAQYIVISNTDPSKTTPSKAPSTCSQSPLQKEKAYNSIGSLFRRNTTLNSCSDLQDNFSPKDLFKKILWINPTKNRLTVYSTVMCPATNFFKSIK